MTTVLSTRPRDLSPGELLRATRDAGIVWEFYEGMVFGTLPTLTGAKNRRQRCLVDRLWREARRRGRAFEGFVELTLYAEAMA